MRMSHRQSVAKPTGLATEGGQDNLISEHLPIYSCSSLSLL